MPALPKLNTCVAWWWQGGCGSRGDEMAHLAINSDQTACDGALAAALEGLAPGAPIVIMVHGFRYCPNDPENDPHQQILSPRPTLDHWKVVSWPRKMRLRGDQGLVIGYGWSARGTIWQAYGAAGQTGVRLARLITQLRAHAPNRAIHLMGHSLGARVCVTALDHAPIGAVRRAILISPAMFAQEARTGALSRTEVISILGRENTAFDMMLRAVMPHKGATLGRGGPDHANWLDLRLDCSRAQAALRLLGHRVVPAQRRVCHWSGYLRPGVWGVYRALVKRPEQTPLPYLRMVMDEVAARPDHSVSCSMP